jgi:hypothetical protein
MGYTHKDWRKPRHRWAKMTNLQNQIEIKDAAFNTQCPDRSLSTWEKAELREICEEKAIPEPQDMTLQAFVDIAGRWPQYFEGGQWITPPPIEYLSVIDANTPKEVP